MDETLDETFKEPREDLEAIKEDIAALKRDLAIALGNLRGQATDTVSDIASQLSDEASALYREVADRGNKATQALGEKVEEQPLTSVMVAFALGYIFSRITR